MTAPFFYWAISLLLIQRGQTIVSEEEGYDPWRESDRPKVVVNYFNGPLRGKKIMPALHWCSGELRK